MTDWRALLGKYMQLVHEEEGTLFLPFHPTPEGAPPRKGLYMEEAPRVSAEDLAALRELAEEFVGEERY